MTRLELRATAALALVFVLRLLGLFMIYPGFAAYATHLNSATPTLIGIALGAYGLTQALLQIPFGLVSDRLGRKPSIAIGLMVFAAGSIVAARASSVEGVAVGRALQGAGAVGSIILALVADLTREEVRTRSMALVGTSIGLSFVVALVLGPVLAANVGVPGIFWLTACLALLGIGVTYGIVPTPAHTGRHHEKEAVPQLLKRTLSNKELQRLSFGIFMLHVILTASFLSLPFILSQAFHMRSGDQWVVYLPVLGVSVALMVPAILLAEKQGRMKEVFLAAIVVLAAGQLALALWGTVALVSLAALVAFFTAFNVMEALLPSLVTRVVPPETKGTAMGIFSSAQYFGIFVGGTAGGLAVAAGGIAGVFTLTLAAALLWLLVAANMRLPNRSVGYPARVGPALSRY